MFLWLLACYPDLPIVDDPCARWEEPGTYRYPLEFNQQERKALVYVPDTEGPREMIVALHGYGANGTDFVTAARLYRLAEQEGLVLAAPWGHGLRNHWHSGLEPPPLHHRKDSDDVAFLEQLSRDLEDLVCVDRIYVFGHSMGAMMAHRWACEEDTVQAVVAAAGNLETATCGEEGDRPVPVRHYHGTRDRVVPHDGSPNKDGVVFQTTEFTIDAWRERNQCSDAEPSVFEDGAAVCESWDCEASTVLCLVEGAGHWWPGSQPEKGIDDPDATTDSWAWIREITPRETEARQR